MLKYIIVGFVCVGIVFSCKKIQPEMSVLNAGCDCAKEVSADFLMEEMTTGNTNFARYTDTDSIFSDKNVRFTAIEDDAEYTWYIGTEVLHTKSVTRYFDNTLVGQSLPISLVVKKKSNTICFPNDDGKDSILKYLSVAQLGTYDFLDTTFLEGTYRMKSPLLLDSVEIVIDYRDYVSGMNKRIDIYNYDGLGSNCTQRINRGGHVNYRQFWTFGETSVTQGNYLQGDMHHRLDGIVEMNFTTGGYVNGNYEQIVNHYLYRGRKL